jgi:hypothetical protein
MANKNIAQFIETYGPVAQQVSKEINVDPNVLLSQWGLESRWGQTEMAKTHHNLGAIKDFSGAGFEAKDNKTGSKDKYVKFEDPEVFGMYYADQIKRNFPLAINTGPDIGAFTRGLASGKNGSYFGVKPMEYEQTLSSFYSAIPENKLLPFEPTAQPAEKPAEGDGDPVLINAPPPPPPTEDTSGASAGERFLGGAMGAGVGTAASGVRGVSNARTSMAASRAGAEETARIAAQQRAAASAAAAVPPSAAPAAPGAPRPPLGSSIMFQNPPPAGGNLQVPMGAADAGRMAPGQTGHMVYNYAKSADLTDIEAGRALDMTKQSGGVHDLAGQRREAMNKLKSMGMGNYVENPMYGGIMTEAPSAGGGVRTVGGVPQSFAVKPPVAPSPDLPLGQPGGLSQIPPRQVIPTAPPPPPPPSVGAKAKAGLDWITGKFAGMLKPVSTAVGTAGRYAVGPLAGLSAGLDLSEIAHEYDKPADQRDYTKMGLKAASAIGGGLSMIPITAPLGIPLSLGATAAQAYREDPEYYNQKMKEYTGYSP